LNGRTARNKKKGTIKAAKNNKSVVENKTKCEGEANEGLNFPVFMVAFPSFYGFFFLRRLPPVLLMIISQ